MHAVKSPEVKIVVEKDEAEELPPGWIVEVKRRKNTGGSKTKVDRFYTDPVSGYVFRSRRDALRYLKTGEVRKRAIKPKKNECVDMVNKDERLHVSMEEAEESSESKVHMSVNLRHKRPLDKSKRLPSINIDSPLPEPKTRRATQQAGIKVESPPPSPPDTRSSRQAKRVRLVALATPKGKDKKTEAEKITDKLNVQNADMDNNPTHNQETNETLVTTKEHDKEIEPGPATLSGPEDQGPPTGVPGVDFEEQELPVVNPAVSNPIPQNGCGYGGETKSVSSNNVSMDDLWTDPSIDFTVNTLTGTVPFGEINKTENISPSQLKVPLEELWTDPCIEFAVKTLTGAIPVGEDVGMSYCQTDVLLKEFETGQNKQQNPIFPTYGLQKSGDMVNGSSGQCLRSRFFQ